MALLAFGTPPVIEARSHRDYAEWLEHRVYDRACAYCLEHARILEIDHVVPEALDQTRSKDPTNLLPACATCNGHTGKWDYHPDLSPRFKCRGDTHGFLALDPRVDDYATLYAVLPDGRVSAHDGEHWTRAEWNASVLFRLNRRTLVLWRRQAMDLARAAEYLVDELERLGTAALPAAATRCDVIVREVAQRLVFFELFEIALSPALLARATEMREGLRGQPRAE